MRPRQRRFLSPPPVVTTVAAVVVTSGAIPAAQQAPPNGASRRALEAPAVLTPVVTPGGDWGHVARKTKPEGERKNARRAASNFTLAQAGVPIKRDGKCSPPAPTSVGNAVGRCRCMVCAGLAIFRTHHICCVFGVQICPNCFRLPQPHMRLGRVEWEALSTTHSVGEQRGQKGGHSKAENLC